MIEKITGTFKNHKGDLRYTALVSTDSKTRSGIGASEEEAINNAKKLINNHKK